MKYLKSKGYDDQIIQEAGLASFDERYGLHDKFWNRVMFPIQDINHRVIGFGGRVMGDGKPKYLNSPETPIFDKSRNLYGLNFARTARTNNIILCGCDFHASGGIYPGGGFPRNRIYRRTGEHVKKVCQGSDPCIRQ